MQRRFPRPIKRIVIKVGSSVIATYKMKPRLARLRSLVEQIAKAQRNNVEVVLVSSGAIVLGMGELKMEKRPKDLASLQALAGVGQIVLMQKYDALFKKFQSKCSQVLLTWDDFNDRKRFVNAKDTFKVMLDWKIVPVINENDTISTEEIRFGDNDKLSALVACLVNADLLLILSDVEGLYDLREDGKKVLFEEVNEINDHIEKVATGHLENKDVSLDKDKKKQMSKGGKTARRNRQN